MNGIHVATFGDIATLVENGKLSTESRLLTPQEQARARADQAAQRKARSEKPWVWTETFTKRWFASYLKAHLKKQVTATGMFAPDGFPIMRSIGVDYIGRGKRVGDAPAHTFQIEVKSCQSGSFPFKNINDNERKWLNRAVIDGDIAAIALGWWEKVDPRLPMEMTYYVVPWGEWVMLEGLLAARANGNYAGKSLRRQDLKLLDQYKIVKVGTRWPLPDSHWLSAFKGDVPCKLL